MTYSWQSAEEKRDKALCKRKGRYKKTKSKTKDIVEEKVKRREENK